MFCFYIWDKSLKITEKCSNVKVIVENCNSQQIDTISQQYDTAGHIKPKAVAPECTD